MKASVFFKPSEPLGGSGGTSGPSDTGGIVNGGLKDVESIRTMLFLQPKNKLMKRDTSQFTDYHLKKSKMKR